MSVYKQQNIWRNHRFGLFDVVAWFARSTKFIAKNGRPSSLFFRICWHNGHSLQKTTNIFSICFLNFSHFLKLFNDTVMKRYDNRGKPYSLLFQFWHFVYVRFTSIAVRWHLYRFGESAFYIILSSEHQRRFHEETTMWLDTPQDHSFRFFV